MTTRQFAGHAGRITGHAALLTFKAGQAAGRLARQIDWREVATIVVLGLVALVAITWEAGFLLGHAVHRAAAWIGRELILWQGLVPAGAAPVAPPPAAPGPRPVPAPIPFPMPFPIPAVARAPRAHRAQRPAKTLRPARPAAGFGREVAHA